MAISAFTMAYPVAMINFIAANHPGTGSQLLGLFYQNTWHPFRLLMATHEHYPPRIAPSCKRKEHAHAVFHAVLATAGIGACSIQGQRLAMHPGDLVLVLPGEPHCFGLETSNAYSYRSFTFSLGNPGKELEISWESMLSLLLGTTISGVSRAWRLDTRSARHCERLIADLHTLAIKTPEEASWLVHAQVLSLFQFLAERLAPSLQSARDELDLVKDEISTRFHETLSVEALAKITNCSAGRLHRRFQKRFGISPIAMQLGLRMQAAQTLLRSTSLSIKVIAKQVGFLDQFQFSRAFRRQIGVSPSQFREHGG